jgi:hypothetical protein
LAGKLAAEERALMAGQAERIAALERDLAIIKWQAGE